MKERELPLSAPGTEWQQDTKFNAAEEILANPDLRDVFKEVIAKGIAIVQQKSKAAERERR
jgi:hypothetical protein